MQIIGAIGYTNVFPIEGMLRDARLAMIWTGTSEITSLIIQHEYCREVPATGGDVRDMESDANGTDAPEEKVYE